MMVIVISYNSVMTLLESLRLLASTGCGIQIGGFLLLSLFHKPLLKTWPESIEHLWLFKRFYRFNLFISLISGVLAILGGSRETGFLLAILGMTYVLLLTHLLPAMIYQHQQIQLNNSQKLKRSPAEILQLLKKLQIIIHFSQLLLLIYFVNQLML